MQTRTEIDSLGARKVPADAYYGIQTLRATENFPVSGLKAPEIFVRAYAFVKKAAAEANMQVGWLDKKIGDPIVKTCLEIAEGKLDDQFIIDVFQAGAGTSFNMNVNEVIANRSLELLGRHKGDYKSISPNDHVNMGQSTNDTFPTALHIATLMAVKPLLIELDALSIAFSRLARKNINTTKSGRTHLQDALPLTIGQEFLAYAAALKKSSRHLAVTSRALEEIALGGTAVGTGANAHQEYTRLATAELCRLTGLRLRPAKNLFEALQSQNALATVSGALRNLALELIRIANDLRLLSSGPTTGLSEIELPPVQPGSSIMPGKVNPVMAECLNMIGFQIIGNDLTVSMAIQAGQLDLNVMTPVIMHNILHSIQILTNYLPVFRRKCVEDVRVNTDRCAEYLEKNPSLAVFLSPYIGYLEAAKVAKRALAERRSVREVAVEKGIITPDEASKIFDHDAIIGKRRLAPDRVKKRV